MKRGLLERAVQADPAAELFDQWLLQYAHDHSPRYSGAASAMAHAVLEEWRLAQAMPEFANWLESGAPSEDRS